MQRGVYARTLIAFLKDDSGAVMAEYALVLAGLTIGGMLAFQLVGSTGNAAVAKNETNLSSPSLVAP